MTVNVYRYCILINIGGQTALFGTINSFVHVVMYSYYFMTLLKPEYKGAWWKKYLTQLQLVIMYSRNPKACKCLKINKMESTLVTVHTKYTRMVTLKTKTKVHFTDLR